MKNTGGIRVNSVVGRYDDPVAWNPCADVTGGTTSDQATYYTNLTDVNCNVIFANLF